jgi:hypothetical protein
MPEPNRWVLTDLDRNVWVESIFLGHDQLGVSDCTVSKRTMRGGLADGVDLVEINNGELSFSVVPTRGMGIWRGNYRGIFLGWQAPIRGPVHPKFINLMERGGLGWLYGFDEWIVRCGLDSNGAPGQDVVIDNNGNPMTVQLTLHGRIANVPAHYVEVETDRQQGTVSVTGHVDEVALFCPGLRLKTTISTSRMSNRLTVRDEIVNLKGTASELELLYHCNFGPPLLGEGSRLVAPALEVAPRDARASEGISKTDSYLPPTPGYVEQVFFYDLASGADNRTLAALRNAAGDKAAVLRYDKSQLPCFTQWKNTGATPDGYVTGLEPGTNYPNVKKYERERGRVVRIDPGKSYRCELTVELCGSREEVSAVEKEIARTVGSIRPAVHQQPVTKFSPV